MTATQWMVGFLLMALYEAHALNHFPENFVVVNRNNKNPTVLTCSTEPVNGSITWTHDSAEIEIDHVDYQQNGGNLTLSYVETPEVGKYTCWSGNHELSSTYLLLEVQREKDSDSFLSCWAESYHCRFSCKWNNNEYTAVRVGLGPECTKGEKSCHWVDGSRPTSNGEFHFELHHTLSPFAEETNRLEITAEAINEQFMLRLTKKFYLRDIVQPGIPTIVSCNKVKQNLSVTIAPPANWSTPHSFFCLEHQIEYILQDDGTSRFSLSHVIPQGIDQLRVRSRDSLLMSNWSQWSHWKNVMTRRKKHSFQELPANVLNCYKKKQKEKRI
ncbi:interleukin-12 subunit beta [Cynoglossus semilaevis]|uniref:Interleukin-12 subunit beta n=1 Tax=Cynoglossus semilaevis TaxID=244447 RepID=A0A3P8WX01_CYNSE|nr:interleukin-12 subunit beta-like [Cynoglossus semilaevis]